MKSHFHRARAWARLPRHATVVTKLAPSPARRVALTFDDGPDIQGTPAILEILAEIEAHATFFVLAEKARAHPDLVRDAVAAGHRIELHGDRHEPLDRVPSDELVARLQQAKVEVEEVAHASVTYVRPPYGRASRGLLRACHELGLQVALWSHDPKDWEAVGTDEMRARIGSCLEDRAIVLLHDGVTDGRRHSTATAEALRSLGAKLADFELVRL